MSAMTTRLTAASAVATARAPEMTDRRPKQQVRGRQHPAEEAEEGEGEEKEEEEEEESDISQQVTAHTGFYFVTSPHLLFFFLIRLAIKYHLKLLQWVNFSASHSSSFLFQSSLFLSLPALGLPPLLKTEKLESHVLLFLLLLLLLLLLLRRANNAEGKGISPGVPTTTCQTQV